MKIEEFIFLSCCVAFYGSFADFPFELNILTPTENEQLQNSCGLIGNIDKNEEHRWKRSSYSRSTTRMEAPWVVLMRTHEGEVEKDGVMHSKVSDCSGTLISQRHVLIAAHCFDKDIDYGNETLDVINSTIYIADCGLRCNNRIHTIAIRAKQIIMPTEYFVAEKVHRADIAIVELEKDVGDLSGFVRPVCLGGFDVFYDTAVDLYGYGDIDPEELASQIPDRVLNLQTITSYILQSCMYPESDPGFQDELCTRNDRDIPRPKPLHGDSGAGALVEKNNKTYVIAVYKGSEYYEQTGHPEIILPDYEVYTRVAPHLFWICKMTGVCVDNLSSNRLTSLDTVATDELTVDINGTATTIEAYPILIKPVEVNWSASFTVPFEY